MDFPATIDTQSHKTRCKLHKELAYTFITCILNDVTTFVISTHSKPTGLAQARIPVSTLTEISASLTIVQDGIPRLVTSLQKLLEPATGWLQGDTLQNDGLRH